MYNKYGLKSGTYTPKNQLKYIGKQLPHYRSGWELKAFISLDNNLKVLKWGSESIIIPYIDTTRYNTTHRYIVDLFFEVKDINNINHKWLIEIKPYNQSVTPKITKRKSQQKLLEQQIIVQRNKCKWNAAITFCKARNWHFGVWTEKGINQMC